MYYNIIRDRTGMWRQMTYTIIVVPTARIEEKSHENRLYS